MSDRLSSDLASLKISREPKPPSSGGWRWLVGLVALLGVGAGVYFAAPVVEARIFKTEVGVTEISLVSPAQASVELTATGYVVPQTVAKVGAKVTGRIAKVFVKQGGSVVAGQTLFELDAADQKSAIASARARTAAAAARAQAARASLAELQIQLERNTKLAAGGAIAASGVEDTAAKIKSLEANVKVADADAAAAAAETQSLSVQLGNLAIAAPISGTAVTKPAEVGDIVLPVTEVSLVELADFSTLLVETDVPEARLHHVKIGGPCEIILDAFPDKRRRGVIAEVSPRLNRAKATATVKVKFADGVEGVLPEMAARVSFLAQALDVAAMKEPPKMVVPSAAVADRAGAKGVFVVDNGKVRLALVTLGDPFGGGFELKGGPPPGTRVVKNPPSTLNDGQQVKERTD